MGKKDISKFYNNDGAEQQSAAENTNAAKYAQKFKKFPVIPVVTAAAVLCAGAVAAVIAISVNNNKVQSAETSGSVVTGANADPVSGTSSPFIEGSTAADQSSQDDKLFSNGQIYGESSVSSESSKDKTSESETSVGVKKDSKSSDTSEESKIKEPVFGKGVKIEGIDMSGLTADQARSALESTVRSLRAPVYITVTCDGKTETLTEDDFTYYINENDVISEAMKLSNGEIKNTDLDREVTGGVSDFSIACKLDTDSVDKAVNKLKKAFNEEPVNARVVSFDQSKTEKFTYADGKNGKTINGTDAANNIREILKSSRTGSFQLKKSVAKFTETIADVKAHTKLIASHYTTCANVYNSNYNMQLATLAAGETVVNPGETFSFNEMTGDTTNGYTHYYDNGTVGGYLQSTAIVGGQYVPEYGGGICQASTTIYIAAMKAGMTAVERHAHAYPSVYADRGLDATIDYGYLDMRFRNDLKYPVYIATYVYDYNGDGLYELLVEFYGPISAEYDEIVPVGWVDYAGSSAYSAAAAQVYFKNGKEVRRVFLPSGYYDYKYDGYSYVTSMMPYDTENGPAVSPTGRVPAVYSPGGCGSSTPVPYGTAEDYLNKLKKGIDPEPKQESSKQESSKQESSKQESSKQESSKPESSKQESSKQESSKPESSKPESSKPESSKPESSKPESSKPESSKPESSKPESSKPESSKPESSKPESSKPESSESVSETTEVSETTSVTEATDD